LVKVEWADMAAGAEAKDAVPLPKPWPKDLARLAEKVLRTELPKPKGQAKAKTGSPAKSRRLAAVPSSRTVNLVFCENAYIRELNRRFRKLDKVTDVLSFIYDDEDVFGEIYIATLKAKKQAPRWKNSFYDELRRLVVHGALHLAGFDHMNAKDRVSMRAREDHYLGL
jgi:rRNA maturation RNase YbeY